MGPTHRGKTQTVREVSYSLLEDICRKFTDG
jgi:hypothetical protein